MLEIILQYQPKIVSFGVYIWNVQETTALLSQLKTLSPETCVILGGPEISYEWEKQPISQYADYIITGWGDISFRETCQLILQEPPQKKESRVIPILAENTEIKQTSNIKTPTIVKGVQPPLEDIVLPYQEYTDEDIKNRNIYVEASRGCPFKCEFCLSSLDKTAWPFPLDSFLAEMEILYQRGARVFKFVDRTFNLNVKTSLRILDFFLTKNHNHPEDPVFAHFELVPDHLPDSLKTVISQFPAGTLQFEIGIQTFNTTIQKHISRQQNNEKAIHNLTWLRQESKAHLHVDLIAGLPGEDINSFAQGFDQLLNLKPHEIQVGILKRLRGTPIIRHTESFDIRYNPLPPYDILASNSLSFKDLLKIGRFARYWDLIANSGKMPKLKELILCSETPHTSAFWRFMALSDALYDKLKLTHTINQDRLFQFVFEWLETQGVPEHIRQEALLSDYQHAGNKHTPVFLIQKTSLNDKKSKNRASALERQKFAVSP
jgi:radical SAM superfamily enzyme YgiQ (UPF0313 family)